MSPENQPKMRAFGALAGCTLLIFVALFWWAPTDQPAPVAISPASQSLLALDSVGENATIVPTTVREPSTSRDDDDSSVPPIAPFELQKLHAHLFEARIILREIEAKHAKRLLVNNSETERTDYAFLPALTREQLDPVYTQLSKSVMEFPVKGAAAKLFRQEANKFLLTLRKLPARVANHIVNKETGQSSYGFMRLSEDTTVTVGEHGALEIHGSASSSFETTNPYEVNHLFGDEPK